MKTQLVLHILSIFASLGEAQVARDCGTLEQRQQFSTISNGIDLIYILGGTNGTHPMSGIVEYNVISEETRVVGQWSPSQEFQSCPIRALTSTDASKIYVFSCRGDVYTMSPPSFSPTKLIELSYDMKYSHYSSTSALVGQFIYTFTEKQVIRYNLMQNKAEVVAVLPFTLSVSPLAVFDGSDVLIFIQNDLSLKFSPKTYQIEIYDVILQGSPQDATHTNAEIMNTIVAHTSGYQTPTKLSKIDHSTGTMQPMSVTFPGAQFSDHFYQVWLNYVPVVDRLVFMGRPGYYSYGNFDPKGYTKILCFDSMNSML